MVIVKNLSKSFGKQVLFEDASFTIAPGEKVGLVGRNGHGKSTFFNILLKQDEADSGTIESPKAYTIGKVDQHIAFTQKKVLDEAALALQHENERWKAEKILMGLGFSTDDFERNPDEFSGGFQVRINLAKALVSEPNLLLLDEPTNYLDITSIRWLVQFLRSWPNELLLITHDRSVMDSVITHTLAIHRQKIRKIEGDTEKMYQQIIKEEEITEKTRINDEKKRKEVELFVNRYRAKARIASRVQSRVKMLEKMGKNEKLAAISELDFSFKESPFAAKTILSADSISFSYNDTPLIDSFSLSVGKGDRICIVGNNGKGKTTLLKLLAGSLTPKSGTVHYHPQIEMGIFEQTNVSTLDPGRTVEQEIAADAETDNQQFARSIAGAMMFTGDDALKKISVLSGGEKARVMLGKILIHNANILMLDEPTNHFDMQSCDSLLEAIDSFTGAVVIVTHNEMFLRAVAERLVVFTESGIIIHEGGYDSFLEKYGWNESGPSSVQTSEKPKQKSYSKKELRKLKGDLQQEKTKILSPLEKQISDLEQSIDTLENKQKINEQELIDASSTGSDGKRMEELSKESHKLQTEIEEAYTSLEDKMNEFDLKKTEFEKKLNELED